MPAFRFWTSSEDGPVLDFPLSSRSVGPPIEGFPVKEGFPVSLICRRMRFQCLGDTVCYFFSQRFLALGFEMNVVLGNRVLGSFWFHEGMQVVYLHSVFFHYPKGCLKVLLLDFGRYPDVLLEPSFHGCFVGWACGRSGCPD